MVDWEEKFSKKDRKSDKQKKKMRGARDRSKFKKTDREKWLQGIEREFQEKGEKKDLLRGRVISIVAQGFVVLYENNEYICSLRGLLKKERRQLKNIVTVGDFVYFEPLTEGEGVIASIEPRKSQLSRRDALTRRAEHILAANIDQVLITASVVNPPLKPSLIDRYIIAARKGNMDPVVIINKIDLLNDDERPLYEEALEAYRKADIPVLSVSVVTQEGMDLLRDQMRDKASVFSGQSGVGKSTLINAITGLDLPVGEVIEKTKKGAHTTTTAHLLPLEFGGFCIDTPGIKSFGMWDVEKHELEQYFTEIFEIGQHCKFLDCTHSHESECAVLKAVEEGNISHLRYDSYQQLLDTIEQEHKRR